MNPSSLSGPSDRREQYLGHYSFLIYRRLSIYLPHDATVWQSGI